VHYNKKQVVCIVPRKHIDITMIANATLFYKNLRDKITILYASVAMTLSRAEKARTASKGVRAMTRSWHTPAIKLYWAATG
jgi:hypothetical protein